MTLESAIGEGELFSYINGMNLFINKDVPSQEEEDVWEELYQGLPYSLDMEYVVDQENTGKAIDTYDQFIGAEVCLPDEREIEMTARFTKSVKDNKGNPRGI